jgi:hypothetical protein
MAMPGRPAGVAPPPVPAPKAPEPEPFPVEEPKAEPVKPGVGPVVEDPEFPGWAVSVRGELVRSEEPVATWSPRWLGYSRYDGVVLTRDELESLGRGPADQQAVRTAIFQYVESGGVLVVLDPGALTLPSTWKRAQETQKGMRLAHGGFGVCIQVDSRDTRRWSNGIASDVGNAWSKTPAPFQSRGLADANSSLPIVDDIGVPVKGMFVLMLLFTLTIGPVNLWLLSRWKRRIWLLWTVPMISSITCAMVFGYMIVAEGWQGRTRVVGFTFLDEQEQRATTLGRSACYSPLTPSEGLHFAPDTEVMVQGIGSGSTSVCDVDWSRDQHLRRGWVLARMPAHFQLRRCEVKRLERLPVSREADGKLSVTNQLGAGITRLWMADEAGRLYTGGPVEVGQRATLTLAGKSPPARVDPGARRNLYGATEWARIGETATRNPQTYLRPRSYLAVLETSPFLGSGFNGAVVRPTESYVLGLMADGE